WLLPWAPFRQTKAAIKLHTLLDLRGAIPSFIHISDGKLHDVNVLDILTPEAGAFYIMDRGYLDFERLFRLHQAKSFFVTRAKWNMDARRVYSAPTDRAKGVICDQTIALNGFYSRQHYPEHLRRVRFKDPESDKTLVFLTNHTGLPGTDHLRSLQESMVCRIVFSLDQAASPHKTFHWHLRECSQDAGVDRGSDLRVDRHRAQAPEVGPVVAFDATDPECDPVRN